MHTLSPRRLCIMRNGKPRVARQAGLPRRLSDRNPSWLQKLPSLTTAERLIVSSGSGIAPLVNTPLAAMS